MFIFCGKASYYNFKNIKGGGCVCLRAKKEELFSLLNKSLRNFIFSPSTFEKRP